MCSRNCCIDDLIECFQDFATKSLILMTLAIGAIVIMVIYLLNVVSDRVRSRPSVRGRPGRPRVANALSSTVLEASKKTSCNPIAKKALPCALPCATTSLVSNKRTQSDCSMVDVFPTKGCGASPAGKNQILFNDLENSTIKYEVGRQPMIPICNDCDRQTATIEERATCTNRQVSQVTVRKCPQLSTFLFLRAHKRGFGRYKISGLLSRVSLSNMIEHLAVPFAVVTTNIKITGFLH